MTQAAPRQPHPILKLQRDSSPFTSPVLPFASSGPLFSPHVHFPPTPRIAATYPAHSPTTYDRKPIIVSPNVVQLPRRGSRELQTPAADCEHRGRSRSRTRRGGGSSGRTRGDDGAVKGSYFHPRAYEACDPEPPCPLGTPFEFELPATPPLVQDLSPSDESDDVVTPPGPSNLGMAMVARSMPLRFPDAPPASGKARRAHVSFQVCEAGSPPLASLPPPPRPHAKGRRPELTRRERVEAGMRRPDSFSPSPNLDEGCLGGF